MAVDGRVTDDSRFEAFYKELYGLARTLASQSVDGNTAEEIAQEIGVREWDRFSGNPTAYDYPGHIGTFTRHAVRDSVRAHFRGVRRRAKREFTYEAARLAAQREWMNPAAAVQLADMEATVDEHLAAQPARRREAYLCVHEEGLEYSAAAKRLNISESTVRVQFHRALQSLRDATFKYWKEDT